MQNVKISHNTQNAQNAKSAQIMDEILKKQLKTYPALSVTVLGTGAIEGAIPQKKYKSVYSIDINKQSIVIPNLQPSDLLVTNLLLEKMGYDFFLNIVKKVRPQFICCSFHGGNSLNITEEGLSSRLLELSYDLFSRNEISMPNGKTLFQLDFAISSPAFSVTEPVRSSYKVAGEELVSLSVYNVGFQKCEPLHKWGPGVRDHFLIHYIISGCGTYICMDKEYRLSAGDCFICYPNAEVSYCADKNAPWEYAWVGFNGADASLILNSTDFTVDAPFIRAASIHHGEAVTENIRKIYKARGNGFTNAIQMTGLLYELLAFFVKESAKEAVPSMAQTYIKKAVEFISENYSYPISIEEIADFIGISRSQLFRCFDSVLGVSPKEYLTGYRIRQACHLLEDTSFSMTAIANSLGFDNSLYFSKAFHKEKGMSPSEYRKMKNNV